MLGWVTTRRSLLLSFGVVAGLASPGQGAVLFQNSGTKAGWDSTLTQHAGTITEVDGAYRSATALRMEQTFQGLSGYHSEVRKHDIQQPGQDLYYGEALQLPANWIFHDQNVTFQQFAQSDVFGSPWILMFVQRDHLFVAHVVGGSGTTDLGPITGLAGSWIRIVVHFKLAAAGAFEVWVNGTKRASLSGNIQAPNHGAIRWSVGMYCTYWRREQPKGLNPMVLLHDQMRVATTYEEADPASWDGASTPPPPTDAGAIDAGENARAGDSAGGLSPDAGSANPDAAASLADAAAVGNGRRDAAPPSPPSGAGASGDPADGTGGRETKPRVSGGCAYLAGARLTSASPILALVLLACRRRKRSASSRQGTSQDAASAPPAPAA
jgi:hypothetical protein